MGLFDKIKSAVNSVTGGAATVKVTPSQNEFSASEPIKFTVSSVIKDADVNVKNVYVEIRSMERVKFEDTKDGHKHYINKEHETYRQKQEIAGEQLLKGKSENTWEAELTLPQTVQSTYNGMYSNHVWEIYAGLDTKGNDPDSGWVVITVKK